MAMGVGNVSDSNTYLGPPSSMASADLAFSPLQEVLDKSGGLTGGAAGPGNANDEYEYVPLTPATTDSCEYGATDLTDLFDLFPGGLSSTAALELQAPALSSPDGGSTTEFALPAAAVHASVSACVDTGNCTPAPSPAPSAGVGKGRRPRSNNHGALMAKANREKKKESVRQLEVALREANERGERLESQVRPLQMQVLKLTWEVEYLRNVVLNDSAISDVLRAVPNINTFAFVTPESEEANRAPSLLDNAPPTPATDEHPLPAPADRQDGARRGAGVCVHVDNGDVSVRFCPLCSKAQPRSSTG